MGNSKNNLDSTIGLFNCVFFKFLYNFVRNSYRLSNFRRLLNPILRGFLRMKHNRADFDFCPHGTIYGPKSKILSNIFRWSPDCHRKRLDCHPVEYSKRNRVTSRVRLSASIQTIVEENRGNQLLKKYYFHHNLQ